MLHDKYVITVSYMTCSKALKLTESDLRKKTDKNKCFDSRADKQAATGSTKFKVAIEVVCLHKNNVVDTLV